MSLTYGFYNSLNGDRKYDATQLSSIFDGIIRDGVFATIGSAMAVTADSGLTVRVGTGRAWFNHTWTLNDTILPITAEASELLLDRMDAVILEVNSSEGVRANSIKIIKGTPASNPMAPAMINNDLVHQYPLCYIYRRATSTEITQSDITNAVGSEECPFVTGILSVVTIDSFIAQWRDQFNQWMGAEQSEYDEWYSTFRAALQENANALDRWIENEHSDFTTWKITQQDAFNIWFNGIKGQLSGDVAANLTAQLAEHVNKKNNPHGVTVEQIGAAPAAHGTHVPTPESADNTKFLRNDNTWQKVTPDNIGAATKEHTHPTDTSRAPAYSYGTADLTAGSSKLETGKLYFVYE